MIHPSLSSFSITDILQLIRSENVGPVTFFQLVKKFGSPKAAIEALPHMAARAGLKQKKLSVANIEDIEQELDKLEQFGGAVLRYGDTQYPELLLEVIDAPPLLFLLGDYRYWQNKLCIAIVGSRNASAAGITMARRLAQQCGEHNIAVVSGLARGIDTAAHQGAINSGTIAVIAGGIDNIYPPENKDLYNKLAVSGAILSENQFGATPQARNFPSRNRIIAGMCSAMLVVEAAPRSGSLITARLGIEYNREIMAIPGCPLDSRCRGTNKLLKDGATLVETIDDILQAIQTVQKPTYSTTAELHEAYEDIIAPDSIDDATLRDACNTIEEKLSFTPIQLDELARTTQIPIPMVQSVLLEMELAGKIIRYPGNMVALNYDAKPNHKSEQQVALL